MAEYCSKMTEHISKITECYIKMAYSKHKTTAVTVGWARPRMGSGGLVNTGSAHRSMRDESEVRAGWWGTGLVGPVRWLAGLGDE
jgi:hypothetical protein